MTRSARRSLWRGWEFRSPRKDEKANVAERAQYFQPGICAGAQNWLVIEAGPLFRVVPLTTARPGQFHEGFLDPGGPHFIWRTSWYSPSRSYRAASAQRSSTLSPCRPDEMTPARRCSARPGFLPARGARMRYSTTSAWSVHGLEPVTQQVTTGRTCQGAVEFCTKSPFRHRIQCTFAPVMDAAAWRVARTHLRVEAPPRGRASPRARPYEG